MSTSDLTRPVAYTARLKLFEMATDSINLQEIYQFAIQLAKEAGRLILEGSKGRQSAATTQDPDTKKNRVDRECCPCRLTDTLCGFRSALSSACQVAARFGRRAMRRIGTLYTGAGSAWTGWDGLAHLLS